MATDFKGLVDSVSKARAFAAETMKSVFMLDDEDGIAFSLEMLFEWPKESVATEQRYVFNICGG